MPIGPWELIVILIIALLVFGPKRLPDMGRSLGKAIREFRNAGKEIQNDIAESIDENERDSTKSANKTV
ncbi:TatA/E family twin arginine-targeting protein translocase [Candidatus Poribacteria bacterium]|nr:TatA/E family twin arginine-targeting protein translocase [Candidatus Poribacteria bacterium]RKU09733.1 MAG: twin-arginine translocase TatA/TatE family subunit [Candidatus Poribacteria bacterium]